MSVNTAFVLWVWILPLCYECEYHVCILSVNTASGLWVWIPPLCYECEYRLCVMSVNTASVLWVLIPPLYYECECRLCIMSVNTASVLWVWIPPLLLPGEHLFILYCLLYTGSTVCVYIVGNNLGIPQVTVSRDFSIHVIRTGYYSSVSPVYLHFSVAVQYTGNKRRQEQKLNYYWIFEL